MTPDQRTLIEKAFEWKNRELGRTIKVICRDIYGMSGYEEEFKIYCMSNMFENSFVVYDLQDLSKLEG